VVAVTLAAAAPEAVGKLVTNFTDFLWIET